MARKERKIVTVLFADLVGFTSRAEELDPEDVEAILRPYHERLRAELERFGGTVEKFIGDAVMAVFGAPVAHEDDPERAVRAALGIRDQIVEDGTLAVRIAVNTGEALVSVDARPEAGEGMVAGDVVNTAARLQSAAPTNSILVGETTYRATQDTIEYREHQAVEAKGKAEPIPVWEAVNPRARVAVELRAPATPLVGRGRERELLLGTFQRVRADRSTQLFTIVGVPGIGKSRLVAELYGELERDPELTHWRQGRSLPYGEGGAFWALAEMVKAEAGILDGDGSADAERKLHETLAVLVPPEDADWLESRLRALVGLEALPGTRDESFAAWRRFAEALAERRPAVLVFEDLHWADDDLLDFVDELVDWVEDVPLLVLGTARPELLDRRPNWGGGKRNALTLSLPPLGDDDTARLLGSLLDRSVLPAETQQALLARAGGNPLYAEQFARMFAERGEAAGELPETVQGIIAARLDSLPAEEKRVLLDAAVLGKTFWVGALGTENAEALLHALQRKEFVRRERRSSVVGEQEFAFTHLLVRDVAYAQLPRADRAERHVRAARWIESLSEERSQDRAELLAHHYLAALELTRAAGGDVGELAGRALDALLEAAEHAQKLSAFSRAERYALAAIELTGPEDARRGRALLARAAAEGELGNPECIPHTLEAATLYAALAEPELAARAEAQAANWMWNYGRRDEAHTTVERALARVADGPPSEARAAAVVTHARLLMLAGRAKEAVEVGRVGLELAERLGSDERQAGVLITIGTARNFLGEDGTEELEQGLEIARRLHGEREFTRGHNNLAEHRLSQGDLRGAERLYEIVQERVERLGMIQGNAWITGQACSLAYIAGDWDRADRLAARFHELVGPSDHYLTPQVHETQALMATARREPAEEELWRVAIEQSRALKDPQALGPTLAARARTLLGQGHREEAAALVEEVLALRDDEGNALYFTWLIDLGWLLHDLGRPAELPPDRSRSVWYEAALLVASGDFAGAADLLGSKGMRTEEAHARLRAAAELAGAERAAQLTAALAFYRSVGATRYIREAEGLMAATA